MALEYLKRGKSARKDHRPPKKMSAIKIQSLSKSTTNSTLDMEREGGARGGGRDRREPADGK